MRLENQREATCELPSHSTRIAKLRRTGILQRMVFVFAGIVTLSVGGCQSSSVDTSNIQVELTLEPSEPVVGVANVMLRMSDVEGTPIEKATVRVEGNMNHAGMKPSFAEMTEGEPGQYSGTLNFTMGGDWFLLVTANTPDGTIVERKFDVPRVKVQ